MEFPAHIFKAYDIRGLTESELSEDLAYKIGRATVVFLRKSGKDLSNMRLIVGYDMRPTSVPFKEAVIRGITDEGVDVVDIGLTSTPVFNFACAHFPEYAAGIMVTASHNPAEYNGFKITLDDGTPIGKQTGMDHIRELVREAEFIDAPEKGSVSQRDVRDEYMKKIFSLVDPATIKPLKVVVDAGNGMGKVSFPMMLEQLPVEVEYLYLEPDGTFPNHEANPLKAETLVDLQAKVKEVGADFGFALDGDADRIGLVDEKGNVVDASFVGALLGLQVIKHRGVGKMFFDLRSSQIVADMWREQGAVVDKCMVGHANIKKLMKETRAMFASELSLHLFYQDMYDLESTDLSLLYVLDLLSQDERPLSEIIEKFKKYTHSGEINFQVADKDGVMAKIEETYKDDAEEVSHLDGVWMKFDWGWVSVRKSNTEPYLRLNLETTSPELTKEKVAEFSEFMSS